MTDMDGNGHVSSKASTKVTVFWVIAPCSLIEINRRFRDVYCRQNQGDEKLRGKEVA
jgi:hypothetical protein